MYYAKRKSKTKLPNVDRVREQNSKTDLSFESDVCVHPEELQHGNYLIKEERASQSLH